MMDFEAESRRILEALTESGHMTAVTEGAVRMTALYLRNAWSAERQASFAEDEN